MSNQQRKEIKIEDINFKNIPKSWLIKLAIYAPIITIALYFIDPGFANGIFFIFLVEGLPYVLISILFFYFLFRTLLAISKKQKKRTILLSSVAFSIFIFGTVLFSKVSDYYLYSMFATEVEQLEDYIPVNKKVFRFTPRVVAYNQMESTVRARTEKVDWKHTRPYLEDYGFGYVTPITPDGLRPQYLEKNPGFVKYDDGYHTDTVIQRINQPFDIGEEMLYTDNMQRQLVFNDFFAQYPRVHYVTIGDQNKFYAVAPKIKYKYGFPFFFIPYWSGTAIIDDKGNIEDLTREEIINDSRFKGKWMAPLALFRQYVEVQDYAVGFWNTFTSVDGMLSVPKLPNNKYPLVIYTESGETYLVIDTEPQGTGRGLYRMYYQNAQTGAIFSYEPPTTSPIIGPLGAMSKVYSLKGYHWHDGTSGTMLALEPCYLTKEIKGKQVLFWKFSITSLDRTRVSATVVVEATEGGELIEFTERKDFESWLQSSEIKQTNLNTDLIQPTERDTSSVNQRINKVERLLKSALSELQELKQIKRDSQPQ